MSERSFSRRSFLKKGTIVSAAALAATAPAVHAAGSDMIKLGIIGCGGRGRGAVIDSLTGNPNVKLYAMGELFKDRGLTAREALKAAPVSKGRIDVSDDRLFDGFDNYKGVIEASDVVMIACASRFHPYYLKAAVQAKKHVFCEKPHGLDAEGVHVTLEAADIAKKNGTAIVSGLVYRYDLLRRQAIEKMKNGDIGEITAIQCDYVRMPYSLVKREPGWNEMEYQLRNWYHFSWLAGDEITQCLLHNLDSALWALGEELPQACYGSGGRSSTFLPEFGDFFDHSSVVYEYANGRRIYGTTRAAFKCYVSNRDVYHGTKGRCFFGMSKAPHITDLKGNVLWSTEPKPIRPGKVQEHYELIHSIMDGKPINDGPRMARSSMVAVLGTMATRSGQRIEFKELFDSKFRVKPNLDNISFAKDPGFRPGSDGLYAPAVPGTTKDY